MIKITLKDGKVMEEKEGIKIFDVAKKISEGLARVATCAIVDGETKDLRYELNQDCKLSICTFESDLEGKRHIGIQHHTLWHKL